MRFMLISYDDEQAWERAGPGVYQRAIQEAVALTHELAARGQYLHAAPLHPSATGTVVRVRDGQTHVTDGPYAETHEVIGGFYLIDVPDVETAIEVARRHPGARLGTVEIRRVVELEGMPKSGL